MDSKDKTPSRIFNETKELILIDMNPKKTIAKFYLLQLLGMAVTLLFCPQYGFKIKSFHGISHYAMNYGPIACAVFCSSVMYLGGLAFSHTFLSRPQFKWIKHHKYSMIVPFNGIVFFVMMLSKYQLPDTDLMFHGPVFDVAWVATSFSIVFLYITLESNIGHMLKARK